MLRRFVSFALLQRKVVARSSAGWIYALITWSFVLLLLGSVWVQFERYVLAPRGAGLYGSAFDRFFQESLDVVGLVFVVAVLLALLVLEVAFAVLARQLGAWGFALIDCQVHSPHLASLGAEQISRREFINYLDAWCPVAHDNPAWRLQPALASGPW